MDGWKEVEVGFDNTNTIMQCRSVKEEEE